MLFQVSVLSLQPLFNLIQNAKLGLCDSQSTTAQWFRCTGVRTHPRQQLCCASLWLRSFCLRVNHRAYQRGPTHTYGSPAQSVECVRHRASHLFQEQHPEVVLMKHLYKNNTIDDLYSLSLPLFSDSFLWLVAVLDSSHLFSNKNPTEQRSLTLKSHLRVVYSTSLRLIRRSALHQFSGERMWTDT